MFVASRKAGLHKILGIRRLIHCMQWQMSSSQTAGDTTHLMQHLSRRIQAAGPLTVASYMQEVLTNPVSGYYMHKDVFGQKGDFITSPEISQVFGEVIAQFADLRDRTSLHLVEVSPKLSEMQAEKLCENTNVKRDASSERGRPGNEKLCEDINVKRDASSESGRPGNENTSPASASALPSDADVTGRYRMGLSKSGVPVHWYRSINDLPCMPAVYVAHEFFDALPIHKFQRTGAGWREIMVDIDSSISNALMPSLRFVLAPSVTPATVLINKLETRDHVEICPEGGVIAQSLAMRITEDGGCALIIDYGHNGTNTDTFRGFRSHKLHDVLCEPGTADLTADVDFAYLRQQAGDDVAIFGPIPQQSFLTNMAIDVRFKKLLMNSPAENHNDLISGYDMIMNPQKMGDRFKFFTIMSRRVYAADAPQEKPAGFVPAL
ncbi:PREDICTED: NADH dehydrogenase [ubiquinone] complex I, assembly factor 7-like isoform X3 [Priapulus caudatus]|uniref:Protein arginine methyltransferase NDUFAF7 n=1 Tax=Priapulus caudatus TaxID=37621 RepID=A0ABM1DTR5_PRICU|nr:PREDICTED: NADH dehydrogenase [ubiquinone] complex I, assembly factor 7-like isoform X3 [Priapulus caudatus]